MPLTRPTLRELQDRAAADVASRLALSSLLPKSFLRAIAYDVAAAAHEQHGALAILALDQFPQTATEEGVLRWADLRGLVRKPATFAFGSATFLGVPGSTIPNNTQLTRVDGARFKTRQPSTIDVTGNVSVFVLAMEAGELGNCSVGTELKLTSSLPGVNITAIVDAITAASGLAGGADEELLEDLRQRTIDRWRNPPRGGSEADWIAWTLEVPGVTRAWAYANRMGPGTVAVTFAVDQAPYGPIPQTSDLDAVRVHLDLTRPITAALFVFAANPLPVDFQVTLTPNTAAVQLEVENSLRDLFLRESSPEGTILLSHIQQAISLAAGEDDHVLVQPTADVVALAGEFPVFGSIAFL